MPWAPALLSMAWRLVATRRFLVFFLAFALIGGLLNRMPGTLRQPVCQLYKDHIAAKVRSAVQFAVESIVGVANSAPSTGPAVSESVLTTDDRKRIIERTCEQVTIYVCGEDSARTEAWDWHFPTLAEITITIPAATILALMTVLFLPSASARPTLEALSNAALQRDATSTAAQANPLLGVGVIRAGSETDDLLRARALRVAVIYGLLSCFSTTLVQPDFASLQSIRPWPSSNTWHFAGLAAAAVAAALYGSWGFRRTRLRPFEVALGISARGIFLGGLIAVCIALPYQVLRPIELKTLGTDLVVFILTCRLIILPLLSALATLVVVMFSRKFTGSRI